MSDNENFILSLLTADLEDLKLCCEHNLFTCDKFELNCYYMIENLTKLAIEYSKVRRNM